MLRAALSHVSLRVPEVGHAARFYRENLGLRPLTSDSSSTRLGLGAGSHVLELAEGDGLDHFGLALPSAAALDELTGRLQRAGVASSEAPRDSEHPAAVAIADPDGNSIQLHGPIDRSDEHVADPGRRPIRIHHVTLGSPDVARMADFYTEALGFRVSDRMGEVFVWMRCNREHHTVAVVQAEQAGIDHYAYEIGGWDDLKTWCDELAVRDVPLTWGPGRHGPGNNVFVMFGDPAGNRIELSAEMERYWDELATYEPRRWRPGAKTINLWGPSPSWREPVAG